MPLTITNLANLPPATRNRKRTLESTEEWLQLRAKLAEGLKPHEAVAITFNSERIRALKVKNVARTFRQMVLEYLRALNLRYDCWRYRSDGKEVVVVAAPPPAAAEPKPIKSVSARDAKDGERKAAS